MRVDWPAECGGESHKPHHRPAQPRIQLRNLRAGAGLHSCFVQMKNVALHVAERPTPGWPSSWGNIISLALRYSVSADEETILILLVYFLLINVKATRITSSSPVLPSVRCCLASRAAAVRKLFTGRRPATRLGLMAQSCKKRRESEERAITPRCHSCSNISCRPTPSIPAESPLDTYSNPLQFDMNTSDDNSNMSCLFWSTVHRAEPAPAICVRRVGCWYTYNCNTWQDLNILANSQVFGNCPAAPFSQVWKTLFFCANFDPCAFCFTLEWDRGLASGDRFGQSLLYGGNLLDLDPRISTSRPQFLSGKYLHWLPSKSASLSKTEASSSRF